jgi:hypothetical protein
MVSLEQSADGRGSSRDGGVSTRIILLRFPDSSREYWATDRTFVVGDVLRHNGDEWTVAGIDEYPAVGTVVTVVEAAEPSVQQ